MVRYLILLALRFGYRHGKYVRGSANFMTAASRLHASYYTQELITIFRHDIVTSCSIAIGGIMIRAGRRG